MLPYCFSLHRAYIKYLIYALAYIIYILYFVAIATRDASDENNRCALDTTWRFGEDQFDWRLKHPSQFVITLAYVAMVPFNIAHSLTISLSHSLTISLSHYPTLSLSHYLTLSLSHSLTLSLSSYLTLSLSHSLPISLSHSLTLTLSLPISLSLSRRSDRYGGAEFVMTLKQIVAILYSILRETGSQCSVHSWCSLSPTTACSKRLTSSVYKSKHTSG